MFMNCSISLEWVLMALYKPIVKTYSMSCRINLGLRMNVMQGKFMAVVYTLRIY